MENFNLTHKHFIQYMLKNGTSTVPRAIAYCTKLENEDFNELKLGIMINQINREISGQYFKIVQSKCEVSQEDIIIWLNLKNDSLTKLQLNYSEKELEYFQAILQEILYSEQRKLMTIVCLNITSTLTSEFSRENGSNVLEKWLTSGYFVEKDEFVHLGPRLISEFTSYLRSVRPECICYLCSELAFTGRICDYCNKMYHSYCIERYLCSQIACPNCKQTWNETQVFKNIENNISQEYCDDNISDPGPSKRVGRRH